MCIIVALYRETGGAGTWRFRLNENYLIAEKSGNREKFKAPEFGVKYLLSDRTDYVILAVFIQRR